MHRAQERAVDLSAGDAKRVGLDVVVAPQPAGGGTPGSPSPPSAGAPAFAVSPPAGTNDGQGGKRTAGWIAVGVGVASLVGAGISLALRQSALNDLHGQCGDNLVCDPSVQGTVQPILSRGQTASTMATVFSAVGGAALVGGIVLLATSSGHRQQAALVVQPGLGGIGGAAARWSF
jgi:hypothetical protein